MTTLLIQLTIDNFKDDLPIYMQGSLADELESGHFTVAPGEPT